MNRRFVCLILLACSVCGRAWADAVPVQDEGVPPADIGCLLVSAYQDDLTKRIKTEVDKLAKDQDVAGQTLARQWLESESVLGNTPSSTSDNYMKLYSSILNAEFLTLLSKPDTTVRAKVNVGIVATEVADKVKNINLLPTVLQLLKDNSDAVVLWGLRAGGKILPQALKNGPDRGPLLDAIVQAALRHTSGEAGGYVVEEAYRDLSPELQNLHPAGAALSDLVDSNLKLQQGRLDLYRTGVPPAPRDDTFASEFLLDPTYWPGLTDAQKLAAIQAAWNFISLACEQARLAPQAKQSATTISELMIAVRTVGQALEDLANRQLKDLNLTGAMHDIGVLGPGSRPTEIQQALSQGFPPLQAAFKGLQPAPEVEPRESPVASQ